MSTHWDRFSKVKSHGIKGMDIFPDEYRGCIPTYILTYSTDTSRLRSRTVYYL